MKARIKITLKNGVLDPQGKAIQNALASLGFSGVNDVRQGKYIEVDLAETGEAQGARAGGADLQGAARQYRDRELRLRAGAVMPMKIDPAHPGQCSRARRAWRCARCRRGPDHAAASRRSRTRIPLRRGAAAGCRHEEGPGTLEAVCSPEFDAEKSATASAAAPACSRSRRDRPDDDGKRRRRARAALRRGAVQGGAARGRVRGDRPRPRQDRQRQAGSRRRASRVHGRCRLLRDQVPGARRAAGLVRFLITPGLRYRLMARALKEDFEQKKPPSTPSSRVSASLPRGGEGRPMRSHARRRRFRAPTATATCRSPWKR